VASLVELAALHTDKLSTDIAPIFGKRTGILSTLVNELQQRCPTIITLNMKKEPGKPDKKFPQYYLDKEFERKRAYDVVILMDEKKYSRDVCEWAVKGFAAIASYAMTTQNAESMADFLDDGGCEALLNIMNRYGEESTSVASFGCMTITILAWSLRELKEFLGEIGACEVVVYVMSVHIGDPEVSEYGSHAVGILSKSNIANSYRLAESQACDILAQVGNFGFNLRHEKCVVVAKNVCYAFAQLAEAVNAKRLMDCGASALVCHLTKLHFKNEDFAVAAIHSICALASLNPFHREELGKHQMCKFIVDMINLHSANNSLVREGCESIMHLSLSPNNADKLSENNACSLILNLFSKMTDVEFGTEICTGCLLHFCTYGNLAKRNRFILISNNASELLKNAQLSTKASYKARENIISLLDLINSEIAMNPDPKSLSASTNASSSVLHQSNYYNKDSTHLISVIHGSEMKGNTVPLHVEVREVLEYDSLQNKLSIRGESPDPDEDLAHESPKTSAQSLSGDNNISDPFTFGMKLLGFSTKSRSNSSAPNPARPRSDSVKVSNSTSQPNQSSKGVFEI
jgi:hypothetical protein